MTQHNICKNRDRAKVSIASFYVTPPIKHLCLKVTGIGV